MRTAQRSQWSSLRKPEADEAESSSGPAKEVVQASSSDCCQLQSVSDVRPGGERARVKAEDPLLLRLREQAQGSISRFSDAMGAGSLRLQVTKLREQVSAATDG